MTCNFLHVNILLGQIIVRCNLAIEYHLMIACMFPCEFALWAMRIYVYADQVMIEACSSDYSRQNPDLESSCFKLVCNA